MTSGRCIDSDADLAEGSAWLRRNAPGFAAVLDRAGPLPLRRRPPGFTTLMHIMVGQQISVAAADGIWQRLETAGATSAAGIAAHDDATLLGCGLSRPKLRFLRALAAAPPDFDGLARLGDAEVMARLTALPGIGPWTAEIYLLSGLGRADVFAPGDVALREASRLAFGLATRPDIGAMRERAADWSPWRAVAARALWAYYRVEKQREGIAT